MILYTEKGSGLHEAIQAGGHSLIEESGVWVASDEVAVQSLIDTWSLDDTKGRVLLAIDALAMAKRDAVVAGISPAEMACWSIKRTEAFAYVDDASTAPVLSQEATVRQVPLEVLIDKVRVKAQGLAMLEATISGVAGLHSDTVKALLTFEAVLAYDITTGWPV